MAGRNDTLDAAGGNDTYYYRQGDSNDTIQEAVTGCALRISIHPKSRLFEMVSMSHS